MTRARAIAKIKLAIYQFQLILYRLYLSLVYLLPSYDAFAAHLLYSQHFQLRTYSYSASAPVIHVYEYA